MRTFTFHEAYHWLADHPIFRDEKNGERFKECFDIMVVLVDPDTEEVSSDKKRNTQTRVWTESGPWQWPDTLDTLSREVYPDGVASHDIELDDGADTFELAVCKLAQKVYELYGDYDATLFDTHAEEVADFARSHGLQKPVASPEARRTEEGFVRELWGKRRVARKAMLDRREKFDPAPEEASYSA